MTQPRRNEWVGGCDSSAFCGIGRLSVIPCGSRTIFHYRFEAAPHYEQVHARVVIDAKEELLNKSGCDQTLSNSRDRSRAHRGHYPTEQLRTRLLGLCGVWFTIYQGNVIRTSRSRVFCLHGDKKLWITDHPGRQ